MQWLLFFCFIFSGFSVVYAAPFRIVIDPGHGGVDTGATLFNVQEADITLQISKRLKEQFQKDMQYEVFLTRNSNTVTPLFERVEFSKKKQADLFISIHANSSPDLAARGAEFYFQSQMPADEETLFLANRENNEISSMDSSKNQTDLTTIIEDLKRSQHVYSSQIFTETLLKRWKTHFKARAQPIRQGPFHVLVNIPVPSILIEIGFITHEKDRQDMTNATKQDRMAKIIYESILEYKEKMDKARFSSHIISHANR